MLKCLYLYEWTVFKSIYLLIDSDFYVFFKLQINYNMVILVYVNILKWVCYKVMYYDLRGMMDDNFFHLLSINFNFLHILEIFLIIF